jgi:hypothetical protein
MGRGVWEREAQRDVGAERPRQRQRQRGVRFEDAMAHRIYESERACATASKRVERMDGDEQDGTGVTAEKGRKTLEDPGATFRMTFTTLDAGLVVLAAMLGDETCPSLPTK